MARALNDLDVFAISIDRTHGSIIVYHDESLVSAQRVRITIDESLGKTKPRAEGVFASEAAIRLTPIVMQAVLSLLFSH